MATETAAVATEGPPSTKADPQDPLPESNWLYRRWFIIIGAAVIALGVGFIILTIRGLGKAAPVQAIDALATIALWLIFTLIVDRFLYLVAPSAEQAGKWFATLSALRSGVQFRSSAQVTTPTSSAATTTSAGKPTTTSAAPPAKPADPRPPWERTQ